MYISLVIGPFCCKPISMRAMVLEYRDWLPILQLSNEECKLCIHGNIFQTGNESFPVKDFILRAKERVGDCSVMMQSDFSQK